MSALASRLEAWAARRAGGGAGSAAAALVACVAPVVVYATLPLPLRDHLVLSLILVAAGVAIRRHLPRWRIVVTLISVAASARYVYWRVSDTLILEPSVNGAFSLGLMGAELFGFLLLLAGYFQTAFARPRRPIPLPSDPGRLPTVDVFVPSYDEDVDIVRRTLTGAMAMEYPHKRVYLLDEQRRPAMKVLCAELGVTWMTRPDNRGAKAGNINHALARTDGELVAVFDADQVPVRSFLQLTVGTFVDNPRMALVQTPHHFYNPDPFERNLHVEGVIPSEQLMFYHVIQVGNDFWNSSFFCGSCAVLRREALMDVGGIAQETVTEDAHTALKMHAKGWDSAYIAIPQAAGLATERFAFYVTQRIRWARGMIQILRLDNPLFKRGLTVAQRLNYFNAASHFLFGIPRMFYLLAPPAWLVFGINPLEAGAVQIAAYALPHVLLSVVGGATISQGARHSFWAEVYETAIAPYLALVTIVTVASPRHGKFKVTAKGTKLDETQFDWRRALPNLALALLVVAGLAAAPVRLALFPDERGTTLLATFWNAYNGVILLAAIAVALDRSQRRRGYRVRRGMRVLLRSVSGEEPHAWRARALDLSEEGVRVRLPVGEPLPERVAVTLFSDFDTTVQATAEVLDARPEDGAQVVRCRFVDLTPAQLRGVIEQMFTGANAWVQHPAPPDRPMQSAREVLAAPWLALSRLWPRRAARSAA